MGNQPNLLFIVSDQQRSDTMECYGASHVKADSLNALASRSFVFENAYVTQPVCAPARATMLTGLYPHSAGIVKNNVKLNPGLKSIAEMVSDDYYCAYYGKWHLGSETQLQHGFDEWLPLAELPWVIDHPNTPYHQFLLKEGIEPDHITEAGDPVFTTRLRVSLPERLTMASFLADEASRFLAEDRQEPFMLQVHFFEPHNPYTGPLDGLHDPETIPVGPSFLKFPEGTSKANQSKADFYMQPDGPHPKMGEFGEGTAEQKWRRLRAQYYSNVTLVDRSVGRILDALEKSGKADNTIIVFTADHGEMAGDHGMLEKRTFYEESSKVPLLLHVPWLKDQAGTIPGNIGHIDLIPTLLDLMNQPQDEQLQGVSRAGSLAGGKSLEENDVFVQWNGAGDRDLGNAETNAFGAVARRSIVASRQTTDGGLQRWKLNLSADDLGELFDLTQDPYEMINLFDQPEHRDLIVDLAARITAWQEQTGDEIPLPSIS
jgi:arylsulfatase A-like enzyme